MLFTAELNQNGFNEFYVNLEDGIYYFESVFATDPAGVDGLIPWNVEAKPLTEKAVQVTWNAVAVGGVSNPDVSRPNPNVSRPFTVYRAEGEKEEAPANDMFQKT